MSDLFGVAAVVAIIVIAAGAVCGLVFGPLMFFMPDDDDEGEGRIGGLLVFGASFVVVVLLGFGAVKSGFFSDSAPNPGQGSCKSGHYISTGKTSSFHCDEYYPPPAVQP